MTAGSKFCWVQTTQKTTTRISKYGSQIISNFSKHIAQSTDIKTMSKSQNLTSRSKFYRMQTLLSGSKFCWILTIQQTNTTVQLYQRHRICLTTQKSNRWTMTTYVPPKKKKKKNPAKFLLNDNSCECRLLSSYQLPQPSDFSSLNVSRETNFAVARVH